jgi:LytS/YehU family sensor histidine kinase
VKLVAQHVDREDEQQNVHGVQHVARLRGKQIQPLLAGNIAQAGLIGCRRSRGLINHGLILACPVLWQRKWFIGPAFRARRDSRAGSAAQALKAQVNPHFLFNSLNSISALTTIDAGQAREMCVRLADFLRTSLPLAERVTVSLAEEMALMKMYLDVEQVRFGGRLRLKQEIDPACSDCDVPALLIQPLVENAVKHGMAMRAQGSEISLSGRRDHDWLRFSIGHPYAPEAPSASRNGLGLRNIRDHLESRYSGSARMDIKVEERLYSVMLTLPMRKQ